MKMNFNFKITDALPALKAIQAHGGKSSRKRAAVIERFFASDRHYTAEELHGEMKKRSPGTSYSTVYRTLKLLVIRGFAVARQFEKGITRFERIHPRAHHDHLICSRCGRIIEFVDETIEQLQQRIAKKYLFTTVNHKLEMYGYCRACRRKMRHG